MHPPRHGALTPLGYRLVLVITGLSAAHHFDHAARDVTGWPIEGGSNAFSASLFAYPVIAVGLFLARRGMVGPAFWMALAGAARSSCSPFMSVRPRATRCRRSLTSTDRRRPPRPPLPCSARSWSRC